MFNNFHRQIKPNMVLSTPSCLYLIISVLLLVPQQIQSANILVILPSVVRSHLNVFESIMQVLGTEHNITFYSIINRSEPHENITEFKFTMAFTSTDIKSFMQYIIGNNVHNLFYRLFDLFTVEYYNSIFSQNSFQRLLNCSDKYEMLIISNMYGDAFFKLSHLLKVPLVQLSSSVSLPWTNAAVGINIDLSNDIYFLNADISNNFSNRITRFIKNMYLWLYYDWVYLPKIDYGTRKHFPQDSPSLNEVAVNTQALLLNTVSPMGYACANTPNVLEIGGLHCHPPNPLPIELESFISGSKEHGVIYFSLGGTVSDLLLPTNNKRTILNVFRKLPQRVLWKVDEDIEDIPNNVITSKWFPQQDILGHNQTKLFITQGGILSLQEAVYHGVPVLTIPLIADQPLNGIIASFKGYGRILKFNEFTEELFEKNIRELLSNQKYTNKVKQIGSAMKDHCNGNADRLKKFIRYLLQHKDTSPLQPLQKTQSQLDIYAFILCALAIIIYLLKYICRKIFLAITYLRARKVKPKIQ